MKRISTFESISDEYSSKQIEAANQEKMILIREIIKRVQNQLYVQLNSFGGDIFKKIDTASHIEVVIEDYYLSVSVMDTQFLEAYIMFPETNLSRKQMALLERKILEDSSILQNGAEGRKLILNGMRKVPKDIKKALAGGEN